MDKIRLLNKENINGLPKNVGVYLFKQGKDFLYIGKAMNIKERVRNHFQNPSFKDEVFLKKADKIGSIETGSEIEALLLEAELIKKFQPKYNTQWKDSKNYSWVAITKEELPRVFVTHQITRKDKIRNSKFEIRNKFKIPNSNDRNFLNFKNLNLGIVSDFGFRALDFYYIGPFVDSKALKTTLKMLRRVFPYITKEHKKQKPCLFCQLKLCPGPCTTQPGKKEYRKTINKLIQVLRGKKQKLMKGLKTEMESAALNQEFEKAAQLRNQIFALENVLAHSRVLNRQTFQGTEFLESFKELGSLLGLKKPIKRIEGYDVSNIQGKQATGSMVVFEKGLPNKDEYRKFKIKIAEKPNDTAMLREVLTRRFQHPEWKMPQVILIDGGIGQLNVAVSTIKQFNNLTIKAMALAKRKNELFIENQKKLVLLKNLPQEISNLILQIRDEAHRFAIGYHKKLRSKNLLND